MLYHVVENPYFAVPYVTGPEYQLIDNVGCEGQNAPPQGGRGKKLYRKTPKFSTKKRNEC